MGLFRCNRLRVSCPTPCRFQDESEFIAVTVGAVHRALDARSVQNVALSKMTVTAALSGEEPVKASFCSFHSGDYLHVSVSIWLLLSVILCVEEKKINHIWIKITLEVRIDMKRPPFGGLMWFLKADQE
ncbi:hypothetical protein HAY10_002587 [Salmonella enterica]|nr:hypothetical protein [Salmonella enterica]EEP0991721.1 hypothetical protein [Salmonella enterica]EEP1005225.1 hypothetical protein [Salmonella enterica]EEP1021302.1 hypothetical protein [Salmonella enterica]EEP1034226.1 hypothetical protein [Salmonella enterica]